jgi:flagellar basal-body rod modification protein FlgD
MAISPTDNGGASLSALTAGTGNSTSSSQVTNAYNTFITLLTSQLQHQDPLNPTDTDTFTQELIQLSGVEQQLTTNQTLSSIGADVKAIAAASGLGYVGRTVTTDGAASPLQNGQANWDYSLDAAAKQVTLNVKDASGNTVYSTGGDTASGRHSFSWNGTTSGGATLSSGDFTLSVDAVDATGGQVSTTTSMVGQVTGVDTSGGDVQLEVGDIKVPISAISAIG